MNKVKSERGQHYVLWEDYQAIDLIKNVLTYEEYKGYLKGNLLKYRLRAGKKDDAEKDLKKAMDYENELKEMI